MRVRPATAAATCSAALAFLALTGCGDDRATTSEATATQPSDSSQRPPDAAPAPPEVKRARCPAGAGNCASATGRIIYVERVDPDGEGDAHFVLASRESITLPGISVIDVRAEMRPHPLPGPGDVVSAAGPVYPGSYGQRQISAEVLHVARR